jgi:APA family basic amino acid/polyamine antiporter
MKYKLVTAISIVIANMVGTGIFTSLGFQLFDLNNITSITLLWMLGGLIALLGSFCYAELSSAFPQSGGEYHFLRISFGNRIGFLSGWTSAVVGFAAPIAASAFAFAKYFSRVVPIDASPVAIAITIVVLVTVIHSLKVSVGASFQVFFTMGKILLLVVFILVGLFHGGNSTSADVPMELTTDFRINDFMLPGFWIGLIFVSYAYSGWNATSYIIDDIVDPIKNVPRSIFIGTILVTVLYVLINYVFMISAPASEMKGKEEVAHVAANYIFGTTGASIVSAMVSFFLISTIGSMIIVGPRVIKRIADDYKEFSFFSVTNKNAVPIRAILLQSGIAIFLLLTSSFEFIITAIGFILSIFTTLVAIGLIVLRIKKPDVVRKIKVPFYPITPILFVVFNVWTMAYLFAHRQMEVLAGLIFVAIGWVIYSFLKKPATKSLVSLVLLCFTLTITSCQSSEKKSSTQISKINTDSINTVENQVPFTPDAVLDNRAAGLAGLNSKIVTNEISKKNLENLNQSWVQKTSGMLNPIRTWTESEGIYNKANQHKNSFVFYPFSGPDLEFAHAFYPEADEYVLCGLEKAGSAHALLLNLEKPVDSFINAAQQYFYFSDRFGFFRTLDMEKQFNHAGVVDILALYIKRAGGEIGSVKLHHWNPESGELMDWDKKRDPDACSFVFRAASGKVSTLYYFSKDLSDAGLGKDSLWLNWVTKRAEGKQMFSLVKSASYLMQSAYFKTIGNYLLNHSNTHIQDDTGIGYAQLSSNTKKLRLYGKYTNVIPVFKHYYQPALAEKYKADSIKSLPFKIGYNLRHAETCLMVLQ